MADANLKFQDGGICDEEYDVDDDDGCDDKSELNDSFFDTSDDTKSPEAVERHVDVSSSCKKRARALNDGADEVDWTYEYGFESLQHFARGGGSKSRKSRASTNRGRDRGRDRGRGVRASVEDHDLTPFELK